MNLERAIRHRNLSSRALVIGIDYVGSGCQLGGCEVDAGRMRDFFSSKGYSVTTMTETVGRAAPELRPTRQNILDMIGRIAAENLDRFCLFYAGHGTQVSDVSGDETDGLDEALVCQNPRGASNMPTRNDLLVDDDLVRFLRKVFNGKRVDIFLMFDACHSGTICDLAQVLTSTGWASNPKGVSAPWNDPCRILCFSGARDDECALETAGGGNMTNKFLLTAKKGDLSLRAFRDSFGQMSFQTPQISAINALELTSCFAEKLEPVPGSRSAAGSCNAVPVLRNAGTSQQAGGVVANTASRGKMIAAVMGVVDGTMAIALLERFSALAAV